MLGIKWTPEIKAEKAELVLTQQLRSEKPTLLEEAQKGKFTERPDSSFSSIRFHGLNLRIVFRYFCFGYRVVTQPSRSGSPMFYKATLGLNL